MMVPVVPMELTKCVTVPLVACQTSGPVVKCERLLGFANWLS